VAQIPGAAKLGTEALGAAEERRQARERAMRYAEQTDALLGQVQFPDGPLRWTVFKSDEPIAAFPSYDGDLHDALKHHVIERLGLTSPEKMREAEPGGGIRARVGRRFEKGDRDAPDTLPDDEVELGTERAAASDDGASA
jgi:hypothetical protein